MIILVLLGVGLGEIIAGVIVARRTSRIISTSPNEKSLRQFRVMLGVVAAFGGFLTWPLTSLLGYPYPFPGGPGRVAGIPFMVAYFDGEGFAYTGPLALPALIGNALFVFFLPQIILYVYLRRRKPATD